MALSHFILVLLVTFNISIGSSGGLLTDGSKHGSLQLEVESPDDIHLAGMLVRKSETGGKPENPAAEPRITIAGDEMDEEYVAWVEEWHRNRIAALKDEEGWLRVSGLFWLREGEQSFGSGERTRIRFPEGIIPEFAGIFKLEADTVTMQVAENMDVRNENGHRVTNDTIYTPEDDSRKLHFRSLSWRVIQRDDQFGIRLFDDNSPHLQNFDGIDRYDIDKEWRVEAEFTPGSEGASMMIENILGQMVEWDVAGRLHFTVDGEEVEIVALGSGDRLFIPFSDATAGDETYHAGRFVYIDRPDPGEKAVIDFNVSYNPPCAINPHTTCPLPPEDNRLGFPIRAGEKMYEMYTGEM